MSRDFIQLGPSPIEGTGVFAKREIPRGTRIIEYLGDHVPIGEVYRVSDAGGRSHVYAFALNETTAVDGARHGNEARFFNHSCEPNCEAYGFDDHLYIYAMRTILAGEELTFDYQMGPIDSAIQIDGHEAAYPCSCGAANCRGTLLKRRHILPEGPGDDR
ncbi:MAG: SET domain-containing protein [Gemmatimonadales bacterium]